ncbi:hypothetical protein K466DRAFT_327135 [Polyporus arcularius HHB13444]|uniref:DUF6697 domain-containing protein n=1 Tax=Polyporus arcularius HHB13444 TaxID=1314778 RepID=A0A5C3PSK0_9APHY|nr:hypothetical protein K466DRAFT_327135 [Polyporus arcularius HHB13444]
MNLDPSKDPVGVQILRDTAAEQAAKIQQLEWELSYLRRQLEGEGACRPDAPASGNGANAPTSASEPSGSRGTNLGLTTPPPSAGRPSTSSPDVEEEEAQNDQENSGSIAQRLRRRKRQSPVESPCVTRSRKRVIRPDPDDQNTTISPQGASASGASFGVTGTSTPVQTASTTHMPALTTPYPPSPAVPSSSTQSPGALAQSQTGQRSCVPLVLAGVRVKCAPALMTEEAAANRLSGCRQFEVPAIDPELRSVSTARSFLASAFGGNGQQPSTVARNGDNFLFPKFEMQPNLPYAFGMPGLLYSASFMRDWKEGRQKLFVGLREGHVWYVGDYVLDRGLALSAEEYRAWPKEMKFKWATYIRTTKKHRDIKVGIVMRRELNREPTEVELASAVGDKNKYDDLRDSEIIQAYEEGREVMNVWRMQCVGFDVKFLQAIHEKYNNYVPVPRVKREKKPVASNNAPPGL